MAEKQCDFSIRHCKPCQGGTMPLSEDMAKEYLSSLDGWNMSGGVIDKRFEFKNFHDTMAFVNAVAWIAHREDHHPELTLSYRFCHVRYTTHAIGGLSENDFICAARVDALIKA